MAKEIIWSHKARIKLYALLEYYAQRNGSKKYSAKLFSKFNKEIKLLIRNPQLGIQSSKAEIRGLIVLDYIIFYEIDNQSIIIHTIWASNQNPDNLDI
ncbi:type II toxin-antitoxin system RelE/ParE family toxin [Pedobacter sp. N23S346]|uniref:type II toxin-antitoxin system RelE/ParE family toxin n=1 Tax=Pedobacter sp. N23S346 TaxID=3402750 RepID=UPI003ACAF75C